MGTILPLYDKGPVTREVIELVKGGQLVEARATGSGDKVGVAAAGSIKCLGIATTDAIPSNVAQDLTNALGEGVLNLSPVDEFVAVGNNKFYPVKYAANCAFGQRLKVAAAGTVTPLTGSSETPDMIVGWCAEPGGVLANAVGCTWIH